MTSQQIEAPPTWEKCAAVFKGDNKTIVDETNVDGSVCETQCCCDILQLHLCHLQASVGKGSGWPQLRIIFNLKQQPD